MRWPEPPPGFVRRASGSTVLYAAAGDLDELVVRGLDRPESWDRALSVGPSLQGRGSTAVLPREPGPGWRLKRMRRGGLTRGLWRDRYPSAARLVAMLAVSSAAIARGIPGARPVALLLESGSSGLIRAWMASEEIPGAVSLAERRRSGGLTREELAAALAVVRSLHDAGIVHPDLNLGNVLVREHGGLPESFVIDLDRARAVTPPVGFSARARALRRLARSCAKIAGTAAPLGAGSEGLWYSLYAGADDDLARRLERTRAWGRVSLVWHRLGWRAGRR